MGPPPAPEPVLMPNMGLPPVQQPNYGLPPGPNQGPGPLPNMNMAPFPDFNANFEPLPVNPNPIQPVQPQNHDVPKNTNPPPMQPISPTLFPNHNQTKPSSFFENNYQSNMTVDLNFRISELKRVGA